MRVGSAVAALSGLRDEKWSELGGERGVRVWTIEEMIRLRRWVN
jgi:hypothetical protein